MALLLVLNPISSSSLVFTTCPCSQWTSPCQLGFRARLVPALCTANIVFQCFQFLIKPLHPLHALVNLQVEETSTSSAKPGGHAGGSGWTSSFIGPLMGGTFTICFSGCNSAIVLHSNPVAKHPCFVVRYRKNGRHWPDIVIIDHVCVKNPQSILLFSLTLLKDYNFWRCAFTTTYGLSLYFQRLPTIFLFALEKLDPLARLHPTKSSFGASSCTCSILFLRRLPTTL